jgi:cell division protein FtsZ
MGLQVTEGLGAGSKPEIGGAAAEEALEEMRDHLAGSNMVFLAAGMGRWHRHRRCRRHRGSRS